MVEQVGAVTREAGQRRGAILVNLRGRDVEGYREGSARPHQSRGEVPARLLLRFGGQFENLRRARLRLATHRADGAGVHLHPDFSELRQFRQAALIFVCVPLAVTGGVFALWARDMPFTISAGVGFIALAGIAVLNGIMLISFINQLRREAADVRDAVIEGTLTRLRPKLTTALVASLGFVPSGC